MKQTHFTDDEKAVAYLQNLTKVKVGDRAKDSELGLSLQWPTHWVILTS